MIKFMEKNNTILYQFLVLIAKLKDPKYRHYKFIFCAFVVFCTVRTNRPSALTTQEQTMNHHERTFVFKTLLCLPSAGLIGIVLFVCLELENERFFKEELLLFF
jgi:hypothetical protein